VGGTDLGFTINDRYYPLHSVQNLVKGLQTPAVDGGILRRVVERNFVRTLEEELSSRIEPRRVLIGSAIGRYDLARSFADAGYEGIYGDFGFVLGLPIPVHSLRVIEILGSLLIPVVGRLPFEWLYPTGEEQEKNTPKFGSWFEWATVIADDFHYIKKFMPERLDGKIIVTNTTTADDVEELRRRGVAYLCTTTPRLEGRTFGTNVMEAVLTAIAGKGRTLTPDELGAMLSEEEIRPEIIALNP
jgi:hypothetical protein